MELIVISESKLKIMLTGPDMVKYELEGDFADCADVHTREAFRHIFEDARAEIGFDTEGERLLVQMYASKGGGCEIFVTKLGGEPAGGVRLSEEAPLDGEAWDSPLLAVGASRMTEGERELLRRVYACGEEDEMVTAQVKAIALRFDIPSDLLAVCRRLSAAGFGGESRVYIVEGTPDMWFLLLELAGGSFSRLPRKYAFLSEYGEEIDYGDTELFLSEYGREVCGERAVETLARV